MFTKNGKIKCDICGKFIGYKSHYDWTHYGSLLDLEPPDPNHAHIECYENQSEHEKQLTERTSWLKPRINQVIMEV